MASVAFIAADVFTSIRYRSIIFEPTEEVAAAFVSPASRRAPERPKLITLISVIFLPVACAAAARQLDPKLLRPTAAARSSVRPNCNIKICVISTLMITAAAADAVLRVTVIVVVLPVVVNVVVFVAVSVEAATVVVAIVAVVVLVVVDLDVVVVDGVTVVYVAFGSVVVVEVVVVDVEVVDVVVVVYSSPNLSTGI